MSTIVANTLIAITMVTVIYLVLRVNSLERETEDLYRQLAHHQQDVNELLKANNPQAYYDYKRKNESRVLREMGILEQTEPNKKEKK